MSVFNGLFTSESVSAGHPDKLCDRISDAILDAFLERDRNARVACETFAANDKIIVAGEFRTERVEDFKAVRAAAPGIVRHALQQIGYGSDQYDIDPATCEVEVRFNHQSPEIQAGVDGGETTGAGDQGLMFGHAVDETDALTPLAWSLASDLIQRASTLIVPGSGVLKPDGKAQVTVRYVDGVPVGIDTAVLSWQHRPDISIKEVREYLDAEVLDHVIPLSLRTDSFKAFLNPAGPFTVGGPKGDTGLTGRKIIVDTYGGACAHGGGAFSGKDPTKVDRSAAYAARHVAKNIVAAGLAKRCTVQLAYAIGVAEPVSVSVETYGTGAALDTEISAAVEAIWDLTPAGIIRDLDLLRPIYTGTAALGHFGRWKSSEIYRWERVDRTVQLLEKLGGR
ncbi:methionine adenosyltransferase [Porphyrobacter sp. LM 6]|jgi:S-adenosylmethionine synthetase|uniref:methionine adenosyltransferase n=1 Tax=Porphyrobacter sp. LM 6 TaxID=1896196 RepID=UPI0008465EBF|nr:methionine adenosyltransferase [Porphyrobacter sp. LM 6]AOL94020.1 methionine adenosyltransferase [Porphyrobacter sp. LM 6]